MSIYIFTALIIYALESILSIFGQLYASLILNIAVVSLIGIVLIKAFKELDTLKTRHWERVSQFWLGGEYKAAILLFVIGGVVANLLLSSVSFIFINLLNDAINPMDIMIDIETVIGLAFLIMGFSAMSLVSFVAALYLIDVFTRDIYLLKIATGAAGIKPHSATFYIIISLASLGFLYFYWLYQMWKWITLLKISTQ
ncbi:MAG: hypothetical protein QXF38_05445 [Pyrobaculum sp.]